MNLTQATRLWAEEEAMSDLYTRCVHPVVTRAIAMHTRWQIRGGKIEDAPTVSVTREELESVRLWLSIRGVRDMSGGEARLCGLRVIVEQTPQAQAEAGL